MTSESTSPQGKRPRGPQPTSRDPRRPWAPSPFTRLARAHAASVSGDALFAIGLAGSVFFSLDFTSARWRVALYLLLTIAPFAIAAPLIGPAIDRIKGGRRWIIVGSMLMRAVLAFFVVRHMNTILFYPEAFGMLIMQKIYSISKSAVIPSTVHSDEELVQANSQLTTLSSIAVVIAAIPGGILYAIGGGRATVALGAIVFAVGTILALQLPPTTVAAEPAGEAEREELRSAGITHASVAMSLIRGMVGFLAFMLAFEFKNAGAPLWQLGLVAATAQFGFFVGSLIVPRLRRVTTEERILVGSLIVTSVAGLVTAFIGGLGGAALLSMMLGVTSCSAKQAFDSIVQRDAPDANRGRSFAKFETRFQMIWVIGALVPIIIPIPSALGFGLIAIAASIAVALYLVGLRNVRAGRVPVARKGVLRRPIEIDDRHPSARPQDDDPTRVVDRGFAGPETPPAWGPPLDFISPDGADIAVASHDAARRWMRRPSPAVPSMPTEPPPPAVEPRHVVDEWAGNRANQREGYLFGPDAWEEPEFPDEPPPIS
ncbi:MAG: MFS transporter [Acidimicrobiia bacterium]|nr:MFS transporter [Acidimicrobiia bacterium]